LPGLVLRLAPWPKRRRTARESEARDAQGQVKAMAVDLATMAERARQVEQVAGERDGLRAERDALAARSPPPANAQPKPMPCAMPCTKRDNRARTCARTWPG
jgi:hypothetical protein